MGCPNAIVSYLAGMQDVEEVSFDTEKRVFSLQSNSFSKSKLKETLIVLSKQEKREFSIERYKEI